MHCTLDLSCEFSFRLNRLWTAFMFSSSAMNIHPHAGSFVIAAGAILGICAGLLWTAQGSLMLAYPTEDQKGKFIGLFWAIFNTGAVVGASVSLGQNFHSTVRMQLY
jgi:Ion channel regulatory protein UNC-93